MNKQLDAYFSDDYAGLDAGRYEFYYGYEVVVNEDDENSDWCFIVKEEGNIIFTLSTTEINNLTKEIRQMYDPVSYLLAGIGLWILTQ